MLHKLTFTFSIIKITFIYKFLIKFNYLTAYLNNTFIINLIAYTVILL